MRRLLAGRRIDIVAPPSPLSLPSVIFVSAFACSCLWLAIAVVSSATAVLPDSIAAKEAWPRALIPEAVWQQGSPQQAADTLANLRERIRALETARDSARSTANDLDQAVAAMGDEIARERDARVGALDDLLQSLQILVDSVSAAIVLETQNDLDEGLRSAERGRVAVRAHADSLARGLENLGVRMNEREEREAEFAGKLAASAERILEERRQRQFGDQRATLLMILAKGLLLTVIGGVWWYGSRSLGEVRGQVAASSNSEYAQKKLLQDQLGALERLTSMLDTIQDFVENADGRVDQDQTPNHDFPLMICNETSRIETNLRAMGSSTRGHKQLVGCVRRVKNYLRAHDYEMVELAGRPYDIGMLLEADFIEDDKLASGEEVITQIRRPEVRYRGNTIQVASAIVSIGL